MWRHKYTKSEQLPQTQPPKAMGMLGLAFALKLQELQPCTTLTTAVPTIVDMQAYIYCLSYHIAGT